MRPRLKSLDEQVIVITGASSGIGRATARLAAEQGARVVLAARSADTLKLVGEEIRADGGEAIEVVADVARETDVRRVAEAAMQRFGGFDTWVNNAGVSVYGHIEDVSLEDQRRVFETNYWGVVNGCRVALEHLRARGGAIINVGSTLSERAFPIQGAYSASKHAVKGFSDALRMELLHDRAPVSVTVIEPAGIDTPYSAHAQNYMDRPPRNPPPIYAPDLVAEAILYAAQHPVRELPVGGTARLLMGLDHWLPSLTDRMMGRTLPRMQKARAAAPASRSPGLHQASGGGGERSGHDYFVRERSAYTWAATHPGAAVGVAAMAGAALAVLAGVAARRS